MFLNTNSLSIVPFRCDSCVWAAFYRSTCRRYFGKKLRGVFLVFSFEIVSATLDVWLMSAAGIAFKSGDQFNYFQRVKATNAPAASTGVMRGSSESQG